MRLLLDTHVLIGMSAGTLSRKHPRIAAAFETGGHELAASVASLWEIAIKSRLGKLDPGVPIADLAVFFESAGVTIIAIERAHVIAEIFPEPSTNDPFDRFLLAQCKVENRVLVTIDRALTGHPLTTDLR